MGVFCIEDHLLGYFSMGDGYEGRELSLPQEHVDTRNRWRWSHRGSSSSISLLALHCKSLEMRDLLRPHQLLFEARV